MRLVRQGGPSSLKLSAHHDSFSPRHVEPRIHALDI